MTITPESVAQLLNSEEYGDRLSALNQLRQLEPAVAFELIQTAVTDKHARVRYGAVSQIANLGKQDKTKALEVLRDRLLNDPETDVKAAAADSLAALKLQEAFADLRQVYQNTNEWLLQFSIIAALGEMGHPEGFELLAEALNSDTDLIKTAAIASLGELGDARAVPLLVPFADSPDWQIRARTAQSLGKFDRPEARTTLKKLAQDAETQVALSAETALRGEG